MLPGKITILDTKILPGGYGELELQTEHALSPQPEPGHYFCIAFHPGGPIAHAPILKIQAADRFRILAKAVQLPARGAEIHAARIEGNSCVADSAPPHIVLVSENIALGCSILAAEQLQKQKRFNITAFAQFDKAPPFKPMPSQILMTGCPPDVIACVPLFDNWNIPSRLTGPLEQSGCYQGDICELLELWRQPSAGNEPHQIQILGYGSRNFIRRLENWSQHCQISLQTAEIPAVN